MCLSVVWVKGVLAATLCHYSHVRICAFTPESLALTSGKIISKSIYLFCKAVWASLVAFDSSTG